MQDFLNKIASESRVRSSDYLQILGKRAASMYVGKDADSLTHAVKNIVEEEDLNRDQAQRVTEMANQAAWKHLFVEEGDRSINFDPACIDDVLPSEPDVQEVSTPSLDYMEDMNTSPPEGSLEELFPMGEAKPEYESLNPASTEIVQHEKAAAAVEFARRGIDALLPDLEKVSEEFYSEFKQGYLQHGNGVLQVAKALAQVTETEKFASALVNTAVTRLKGEGVTFNTKREMEKAAAEVIVDTTHPLLRSAVLLEKLAMAYNQAKKSKAALEIEKKRTQKLLKTRLRG